MLIQIHVMIQRQINKLIKIKENFVNTDQSVILILQKRERERQWQKTRKLKQRYDKQIKSKSLWTEFDGTL